MNHFGYLFHPDVEKQAMDAYQMAKSVWEIATPPPPKIIKKEDPWRFP